MQIIVFVINDKYYAIKTDIVEEVCKDIKYSIVPKSPKWVEGLINLRGNVVTLVNLSKLLQQYDGVCYNNIIIIHNKEEKIGLMVNAVDKVMNIKVEDIQSIEYLPQDGFLGVIRMDDKVINVIDIEKILSKNEG